MSDFPEPEKYSTITSGRHINSLLAKSYEKDCHIVIKKGKEQYLYDLDGNKYADFYLNNGAVILGHASSHLTPMIKNSISYGFSWTGYNKFNLKLESIFRGLNSFKNISFFQSELSALIRIVNFINPKTIGASSSFLLDKLKQYFPFIDISIADKSSRYDLLFLEPIDFDGDLSEINYSHFKSGVICSYESRTAFRLSPGFIKTPPECLLLLSSFNISNGMDSAVLMSGMDIPGDSLSQFQSSVIYETMKLYNSEISYGEFIVNINSPGVTHQNRNIFKIDSIVKPSELLKYGIYLKGNIGYLSIMHSKHDVDRLTRAIKQLQG